MKHTWNTVRGAWGLARPDGEVRLAPDGTEDGGGEAGMATAEYAIGTLAAASFAGLLLAIMRSGSLQSALQGLIESAPSASTARAISVISVTLGDSFTMRVLS